MTCRDCIHHDVCKDFIDTAFDGFLDDGDEVIYDDNNMRGDDCEFYQARSRFVELPFKSRSHYYRILSEIDGYVIAIIFQSINAYHDREEAEQALKERIENDA